MREDSAPQCRGRAVTEGSSRRGGPLRTTACFSTSSHAGAATGKSSPTPRSASPGSFGSESATGRGSVWASVATAALANVSSVPSAAVIRASARCRSQATTSAATVWTTSIGTCA